MILAPLMRSVIPGTAVLLVAGCLFAQEQARISTRFGPLTIGKDRELLFRGRPFVPSIVGNNGLDLGQPFHVGTADVVLVSDNGGTACPYLYHFVTVTRSGAKATRAFGTCNAVTRVKPNGNSILVTMRGYRGPFEPESERRRAFGQVHVFVFREGVVNERHSTYTR
jgi:hypothetical protein